jgi:hypothetical protein
MRALVKVLLRVFEILGDMSEELDDLLIGNEPYSKLLLLFLLLAAVVAITVVFY